MRALLLLLGLVAVSGCVTKSLDERDWYRVQTPHFEIVSALSPEETERLASNAELFRSTGEYVMQTQLPEPSVPTTIYAFDNRGFRRPFAVRGESSHFLPTPRGIDLIFRTGGGWSGDATRRLRRDYMNVLIQNHPSFGQHLWFDEGFSQLMSTVDVRENHVDLGHFRADYVALLKSETWIPILRILRTQDLEDWGARRRPMFYAESWAFVHWVYFGQQRPGGGRALLAKYFKAIEQGYSYEEAIVDAFGRSSTSLDRIVQKYARNATFDALGLRFTGEDPEQSYELESMRDDDIFNRLGWLLIDLERPNVADEWFDRALARNPNAARSHAGRGRAAALRQEWDAAQAHLERALEIEPNDSLNRLDLGRYYRDRALATPSRREREQYAVEARRQLRISWQLDESRPEPFAVYGASYLIPGEDPSRGLASLQRANRMLPSDQSIELDLARMYLALGQPVRARKVALGALSHTRVEPIRREAAQLVDEIERSREAARESARDGTP